MTKMHNRDKDLSEGWGQFVTPLVQAVTFCHGLKLEAKETCKNSTQPVQNHIEDILDMVDIGSGAKRKVEANHPMNTILRGAV